MKIKMLRTYASPEITASVGKKLECSDGLAKKLIARGAAQSLEEKKEQEVSGDESAGAEGDESGEQEVSGDESADSENAGLQPIKRTGKKRNQG